MTSRRIPRNWWGIAAALAAVVALAGWIWATTGIFRPEGFGEDPRAGTAYALTSIAAALAVVLGGVGLAQRSRAKGLAGIGFGAGVVTLVAAVPVWLPVL